jgi:acetolactate synthase-1/2/3 large subunit
MAVARQVIERSLTDIQQCTGGEIMCQALVNEGVTIAFGYPGGAIMPFYDALYSCDAIHHVLVRHEQAAVHMADGYARVTGQPTVCCGTSGPGATNMVTGLANAFMDSVPIVAITGQVSRPAMGKDSFQETDMIGVTMSVTKHNILVQHADDLGPAIHEAFAIARAGRPGPVLIDVPKDVQFELANYEPRAFALRAPFPAETERERQLRKAAALLDAARQPLIMAGHGVILSNGFDALRHLAEKIGVPVTTTLLGISSFPESHPLAIGLPGMHGPASVNHAINEADVLLAVGMRFDDRITGKISEFAPNAKIIHIEIEAAEIEKVVPTEVPIHGDARDMLERLTTMVQPSSHDAWVAQIRSWERPTLTPDDGLVHPAQVMQAIKRATNGEALLAMTCQIRTSPPAAPERWASPSRPPWA